MPYDDTIAILSSFATSIDSQSALKEPIDYQAELSKQIEYVIWCLEHSDDYLFSKLELSAINNNIQAALSQFPNLPSNTAGHARSILSNVRDIVSSVQAPRRRKISRQESRSYLDEVAAEVFALSNQINESRNQFINASRNINEQIEATARHTEQISQQISAESTGFSKSISDINYNLETRIATHLSTAETRISLMIDENSRMMSESIANWKTSQVKMEAEFESTIVVAKQELDTAMQNQLNEADSKLKEINNIFGAIGANASAGDLSKSANQERQSYYITAVFGLVLLVVGSIFAYSVIEPVLTSDVKIQTAIARIAVMFSIFLPAAYVVGLASKHRRAEVAFRSLSLRIAAFEPFLANLNEAQKSELRLRMSDIFFNTTISDEKLKTADIDLAKIPEKNLTLLLDLIEKIKSLLIK
jgi:polyhydroxyalkanoate synthesis regulator phasin